MRKTIKNSIALILAFIFTFGISPFSSFVTNFEIKANAGVTLYWPVPGHTKLSQGFHSGSSIDISDGSIGGANVVAAIGGTVTHKFTCNEQHYGTSGDCNGFGTGLVINGTDGRIYQYAHMKSGSIPSGINVGSTVTAGQVIGKVGTTGNSSGIHLHFGISTGNFWNNSGINPSNEDYIYNGTTEHTQDYTISYNSNGGSGSMSSFIAKFGVEFSFPSNQFTRSGYEFSGWNLKRNDDNKWFYADEGWKTESEGSSKGLTKNLYATNAKWSNGIDWSWTDGCESATSFTLYAVWTPKDYTISYNSNGGSGSMSSMVERFDQAFSFSTNQFTKSGYEFSGWNLKRNDDNKWFVGYIGWETDSEILSKGHSKALYSNNMYWSEGLDSSWTDGCESATSFTLYAVWTPKNYTISYNSNGGSGSMSSMVERFDQAFSFSTNQFAKSGYEFSGWNLKRNDDNKWFVGYIGWKTDSEILSKGHSKALYSNNMYWSEGLDSSWTDGCESATGFTLYAVWEKEVCSHTVVTDPAVAATCSTTGKTQGSHCSKCNAILTAQQTVSALGHSYGEWKTTKAATCTTDGVKTHTCTRCNHSETQSITKNGHSFGEWYISEESTINAPGKMQRKCIVCGHIEEKSYTVDASGFLIRKPSTSTIDYGDSIVLHFNTDVDLPAGAKIVWSADNGNFSYSASADGKSCMITPQKSGDTTFTAKVVDANGNAISEEYTQKMTSKAGFIKKLIAFFKKLFGATKIIAQAIKYDF